MQVTLLAPCYSATMEESRKETGMQVETDDEQGYNSYYEAEKLQERLDEVEEKFEYFRMSIKETLQKMDRKYSKDIKQKGLEKMNLKDEEISTLQKELEQMKVKNEKLLEELHQMNIQNVQKQKALDSMECNLRSKIDEIKRTTTKLEQMERKLEEKDAEIQQFKDRQETLQLEIQELTPPKRKKSRRVERQVQEGGEPVWTDTEIPHSINDINNPNLKAELEEAKKDPNLKYDFKAHLSDIQKLFILLKISQIDTRERNPNTSDKSSTEVTNTLYAEGVKCNLWPISKRPPGTSQTFREYLKDLIKNIRKNKRHEKNERDNMKLLNF